MAAEQPWCRFDPGSGRLTLNIHVQPNARTCGFAGLHGDALKIRIAAPAVDDKANAALINYLHRFLGLPASLITIRHGARGRRKVVEIAGADASTQERIKSAAGGEKSPDPQ